MLPPLRHSRVSTLALLIGALFGLPVQAGPNDGLQVYGALGYGHDDNLLRVPEGQPAFDNTLGDSWHTTEGGLLFDHMYSRQRINGYAKLSKVTFDHFTQLDYDGKDLLANWNWQLGNHLEGTAGASYAQVLAPYTDFASNQRNLRQERRQWFDGAWRFHPSWQLRTAASSDKFTYELLSQQYNNRTEDAAEVGVDYLAASGSTVGLVARKLKGKYPNRRPVGQFLVDDTYDQDELKAKVNWMASGSTNIQLLGGWVRRSQLSLGEGSTSGVNGRLSATYTPRGKMSYNAALYRDFAPLESTIVSYTLNKGASVGAVYDATAKIQVDGTAVYEKRNYNARLALSTPADLSDAIRSATLRATYAPLRNVKLSLAYAYQARSGSIVLGTGRFKSNSIVFNASAQF
ncbi:MAG TPA: XrtB/PEP-CTERM-associated polysaccharide biosynthesis outer membrane protein EpsL [Telluria sp.]|nr:XrtB/PEP-CTERM-associated polysaccharide biosynthesis outer membrane protein EpsL [Telluria sp.]